MTEKLGETSEPTKEPLTVEEARARLAEELEYETRRQELLEQRVADVERRIRRAEAFPSDPPAMGKYLLGLMDGGRDADGYLDSVGDAIGQIRMERERDKQIQEERDQLHEALDVSSSVRGEDPGIVQMRRANDELTARLSVVLEPRMNGAEERVIGYRIFVDKHFTREQLIASGLALEPGDRYDNEGRELEKRKIKK